MNVSTGREFSYTNPQDDPHLYPAPPSGFQYDCEGRLCATPQEPVPNREQNEEDNQKKINKENDEKLIEGMRKILNEKDHKQLVKNIKIKQELSKLGSAVHSSGSSHNPWINRFTLYKDCPDAKEAEALIKEIDPECVIDYEIGYKEYLKPRKLLRVF